MDTAFTAVSPDVDGTSTAVLSGSGSSLEVWAEPDFTWWQVYTSDYFEPGSDRLRRSLAVEAMTCGPDAFNTHADLIVLEPGRQWTAAWECARTSAEPAGAQATGLRLLGTSGCWA